jgi:preprotein translocase subunit SecG
MTNFTYLSSDEFFMLNEQAFGRAVYFWFSVISLPLGTLFNTIGFAVFLRKRFRQTTQSFYYCWLIIFDTAVLYTCCVQYLMTGLNNDPQIINLALCKFFTFFIRYSGQCSSWFDVFITADRFLYVVFPSRFDFKKKVSNLYKILIGMLIVLLAGNFTSFWFIIVPTSVVVNNITITSYTCTGNTKEVLFAREMFALFSLIVIPFIIMFILNLALIKFVFLSKQKAKNYGSKVNSNTKKENQFAITVLSMTTIFLIFNIPLGLISCTQNIFKFGQLPQSALLNFSLAYAYTWSRSIAFFYHALPFFIHYRFNKLFRDQLFESITEITGIKFQPKYSEGSSVSGTSSNKIK